MQLQMNFEQEGQLQRVTDRIGRLIVQFFDAHQVGETFHAEDLRKHVDARMVTAPGSSDRVMRSLRLRGVVNYEVVNRRESLYRKL